MEIDIAPAPLHEASRDRGGHDLVGASGDGNGRRDAGEDEQRGEQETAADAEHAGQEADCRAEPQHHQEIHRDLGYRQIDLQHWVSGSVFRA